MLLEAHPEASHELTVRVHDNNEAVLRTVIEVGGEATAIDPTTIGAPDNERIWIADEANDGRLPSLSIGRIVRADDAELDRVFEFALDLSVAQNASALAARVVRVPGPS